MRNYGVIHGKSDMSAPVSAESVGDSVITMGRPSLGGSRTGAPSFSFTDLSPGLRLVEVGSPIRLVGFVIFKVGSTDKV